MVPLGLRELMIDVVNVSGLRYMCDVHDQVYIMLVQGRLHIMDNHGIWFMIIGFLSHKNFK